MSLLDLQGTRYGPFRVRMSAEQVGAYVAATRDDPQRWTSHAPPSFAGALLFATAPSFLHDDAVKPYTKLLVHADQTFAWHKPLAVGVDVSVEGELSRVRERTGISFATFNSVVSDADGALIEGVSTFLMGDGRPPDPAADEGEPPVEARDVCDPAPATSQAAVGPVAAIRRSASRLDLVRYAAASGDFNPVHFDHETAVRAGFAGVLVHGLLMAAWLTQPAVAVTSRPDPLEIARFRFRNPLRPAAPATVGGEIMSIDGALADARLTLGHEGTEYVDARIRIRTG